MELFLFFIHIGINTLKITLNLFFLVYSFFELIISSDTMYKLTFMTRLLHDASLFTPYRNTPEEVKLSVRKLEETLKDLRTQLGKNFYKKFINTIEKINEKRAAGGKVQMSLKRTFERAGKTDKKGKK